MADPAKGHKSFVQIGTQSVYDTAVAATQKLEVLSSNFEYVKSELVDESLYDGRSPRAIITGGVMCRGTLRRRANYEGGLQLLRSMMGNYAASTVETGVRDHTFKEGDQRILSIEESKGDIPTGKVFRAVGMKPSSMTFEAGITRMATFEYGLVGKDLVPDFTPTPALSFPAVLPVQWNQIPSGALVDGTADPHLTDVRVRSLKVAYNWPLEEDAFQLGPSANMSEPFPTEMISCEWEIEQEFRTKSAFETFLRGDTESTLDVKFQHPTTIGASSKREIHLTSWKARLMNYTTPVDKWGKLVSTARWRAFFDTGTSSCLVVRIRNTEAALP